jgi:hypothetical protein
LQGADQNHGLFSGQGARQELSFFWGTGLGPD